MIEQLFGSKTRVKLLHLFFTNPNRAFYVREITRKIDEQINSVRRELSNLLSIGIVKSDDTSSGNKLYYEVDQNYKYFDPLQEIFAEIEGDLPDAVQSSGHDLSERIRDLGSVKLALLSGSFTRSRAPVDLLIVGDVNRHKLESFIEELEEEEGRELRYGTLGLKEYQYRKSLKDRFVTKVLNSKKTVLIDKLGEDQSKVKSEEQPEAEAQNEKVEDTADEPEKEAVE